MQSQGEKLRQVCSSLSNAKILMSFQLL